MGFLNGNQADASGGLESGEFPFEWYPDPQEPTDTQGTPMVKWTKINNIVTLAFPHIQATNNYGPGQPQYISLPAGFCPADVKPAWAGYSRPFKPYAGGSQEMNVGLYLDEADPYLDIQMMAPYGSAWDSTINIPPFTISYSLEW